jgi:putative hydrolase of the HAD superfamily
MEIRAVILDRDGVLADFDYATAQEFFGRRLPISLQEISDAWEAWGKRVGFPRDVVEEAQFFQGFWDELSDTFGVSPEVRRQFHDFDYTTCLLPFPDALPCLVEARRRGLRVGVLSNFSLASLDASLQAIGLADLVDAATAAPVIGVAKPVPEAYWAIVNALGVSPDQCLFFDNERECVEGGNAVGLQAYLVDRERNQHVLDEGVVRDLSALSAILDSPRVAS